MGWKSGTPVTANVDGHRFTGRVSDTPAEHRGDVAIDTDQETPDGSNYIECQPQDVKRR